MTLLRRALQPIGLGVILGVLAIGWLAYFVTSGGPGPTTDGLGRALVPSPWLMRLMFGQEKEWAGWLWFGLDMVWFWGGMALGMGLVSSSGEDGPLDPTSDRHVGGRMVTALAVMVVLATAYGFVRGAHATVRVVRAAGLGATPSFGDRLEASLAKAGARSEVEQWIAAHAGPDGPPSNLGRRMGAQGMRRLPLSDQELRVRLQLRMLGAQTPEACGDLIRGGPANANVDAMMASLGPAADTLADLMARALLAEIRAGGTGAPAEAAPMQAELVMLADRTAAGMTGDLLARFERVRAQIDEAAPVELCWFTQTVLRSALAIDDAATRRRALGALAVLDGGL